MGDIVWSEGWSGYQLKPTSAALRKETLNTRDKDPRNIQESGKMLDGHGSRLGLLLIPRPRMATGSSSTADVDIEKLLNREATAFQREVEVERILKAFKFKYVVLLSHRGAAIDTVQPV
jgi:hypothetical protein